MNKKQILAGMMAGLMVLISLGCAIETKNLYSGPELPPNKIATVTMDSGIQVDTVDNIFPRGFRRDFVLHMLPGEHTITVWFEGGYWRSEKASLTFVAAAGKSYHISATSRSGSGVMNFSLQEVPGP